MKPGDTVRFIKWDEVKNHLWDRRKIFVGGGPYRVLQVIGNQCRLAGVPGWIPEKLLEVCDASE
jgi:hypothetical protein